MNGFCVASPLVFKRTVLRCRQLLYRLTITLLVVWMAIFAPATCIYHGLLLRVLPAHGHVATMAHNQQVAANLARTTPAAATPQAPMLHHQTLAGETSTMVLLAIALPGNSLLAASRPTLVWVVGGEFLQSVAWEPPIRPPRLL